ncbi:uncharacterized protein LOC143266018 isoform X5 [Megachile rotundata]|uniref:uncharacterized protein LOC143266018 isoform X5 n=1 Tax=Megachile rotundata TaxID=143995 RepID=UPI003FD67A95
MALGLGNKNLAGGDTAQFRHRMSTSQRHRGTNRGTQNASLGLGDRERRRRGQAARRRKEVVTRCSAAADLIARNEHSERVRHGSFTLPDAATRPKVIFVHEHRPKPPTLSRMQISHKKTLLLL